MASRHHNRTKSDLHILRQSKDPSVRNVRIERYKVNPIDPLSLDTYAMSELKDMVNPIDPRQFL